ncbi:MAG: polyprenol monophosphomannose synthase [Nannocystaceae bacterium]
MSASAQGPRPVVLLPTYNERENLAAIVAAIRAARPDADILVIDDQSPDGTGELADELARADPAIDVLHRAAKEGLGRAYVDGFRRALASARGYTHIITMDADFSHDPAYLDPLIAACEAGADAAIGSRWVAGGGVRNWSLHRRLLSRGGSLYARLALGLSLRDLTAGFVCYTREALAAMPLDAIEANGYGFQIEMKHRLVNLGLSLRELPIVFPDRTRGASKMSPAIMLEAVALIWRLRRKAADARDHA